jgi:hypothetical protein
MKKIIILAIIVLSLSIVAYFSVMNKNSSFQKKDKRFSIEISQNINRIRIKSLVEESNLTNSSEGWLINDKRANQQRVKDMLMIAGLIDAVSPVSEGEADSIKQKIRSGTQVDFFEGKTCLNSFRICKWNNRIFAQRDRSRSPFRIAVKGYPTIDLTRVLSASPIDWSENIIMDFKSGDIRQVSVSYPRMLSKNFVLKNFNNLRIQILNKDSLDLTRMINHEAAVEYLNFFSSVHFITLPDSMREKIKSMDFDVPLFTLNIQLAQAGAFSIAGFQKTDFVTGKSDRDQFIAFVSDRGYILLNYSDFDPILVPLDYFLKK